MFSSFHRDWTKTWSPCAILVSDWLKFKQYSLKLTGTMNCYSVRMMCGIFCAQLPYFLPIMQPIWL